VDKRHNSGWFELPLTALLAIFDAGVDEVPSVAEVHAILDGHVVCVHIADR
jgi:hypothetical protein